MRRVRAADGVVAATLDKAVNGELKPLKLDQALFSTAIKTAPDNPGPDGIDRVEFWVRTNPGTQPGPLMKVASGGELARFLLAMKVVLAEKNTAPVLVFDEIDSGIGGRAAEAVGRKLKSLARSQQVLCVTHLPQIASFADQHYRIDKREAGGRTRTSITRLDERERTQEVARMLSGARLTETSLKHAEQLLKTNA